MRVAGPFRRTALTLLAAASVASLSAGPAAAAPAAQRAAANSPWAQTDYNAAGSRANLAESTLTPSTVQQVRFLRNATETGKLPSDSCASPGFLAPDLTGGQVFAMASDRLVSYSAATGHRLWQALPDPALAGVFNSVAVADGLVLVGWNDCGSASDPNGTIEAFRQTTGALVWSQPAQLGGGAVDQLTVSGKFVIAFGSSAGGGQVLGIRRISDGGKVWLRNDQVCGGPTRDALVSGLIVTAECSGNGTIQSLVARKLSTGAKVWSRSGTWAVDRGDRDTTAARHLYVVGASGQVVDLNPATGTTQRTLAGATSVLAVDGSRAYATCGTGNLCAYNASTGALQWTITDGSAFAAEAGGVLYLADGKALDASTGTLITQLFNQSGGAAALVVGDGRVGAALGPTNLSLYGLAGS